LPKTRSLIPFISRFDSLSHESDRLLDRAAKTITSVLDVVVTHYLTDTASEVFKAMNAKWISDLV
jgi:hypothetical protein